MLVKFGLQVFICFFILLPSTWAAKCRPYSSIPSKLGSAKIFLQDAVYALHEKFINQNFDTKASAKERAELFDTVFASPHWIGRARNPNASILLWNWVRKQYWGALNQQALLKEEQGYALTNNKALSRSFSKIFNFPIYPYVSGAKVYNCKQNDMRFYPCHNKIYQFKVTLSPSLACTKISLKDSLTFDYLVIDSRGGWVILDVKLKGFSLIRNTYAGFEDLRNKYGSSKALKHTRLIYSTPYTFKPNDKKQESGSVALHRNIKVKAPKYPLIY